MANHSNKLLSNRVVIFIATLLAVGILLDGKAYNRVPPQQSIYPITDARTVKISNNDRVIIAFEKTADRWLQTIPTSAPVSGERVQFLIDSNHQTNRRYATSELPVTDLFNDAVKLDIDGYTFTFGPLEAVSKQRYVLAEDTVYLQADRVLPMLHAGTSAFIDLTMTTDVKQVSIAGEQQDNAHSWSRLKALGVIGRQKINTDSITSVQLEQQDKRRKQFNLHRQNGTTILISSADLFGYILSPQQSSLLGLTDYD